MEKELEAEKILFEIKSLNNHRLKEIKSGSSEKANEAIDKMDKLISSIKGTEALSHVLKVLIGSADPQENLLGCAYALSSGVNREVAISKLQEILEEEISGGRTADPDVILYLDMYGTHEEKQVLRDLGFQD